MFLKAFNSIFPGGIVGGRDRAAGRAARPPRTQRSHQRQGGGISEQGGKGVLGEYWELGFTEQVRPWLNPNISRNYPHKSREGREKVLEELRVEDVVRS